MKVLWLSLNSSLFYDNEQSGWTGALENALKTYYQDSINLAVAFENSYENRFKIVRHGTTYYPLNHSANKLNQFLYLTVISGAGKWKLLKDATLRAIHDFQPDIIHCFGSEWPYGIIVKEVPIPVVIHMQGFLNIYLSIGNSVIGNSIIDNFKKLWQNNTIIDILSKIIYHKILSKPEISPERFEREIMKANHYFMGRTEWDKNIVKYFSPGSRYFHVPEAIRPIIYQARGQWKYHFNGKLQLLTITSGSVLKGAKVILQTAQILQDIVGLDFTWKVAGNQKLFPIFEKQLGIRHDQVGVELLGTINQEQIVEELTASDFFIHPSIIDNSPNAICEAQLIGIPVIASNVGGVPQLIDDKKTGFLFPYNEPHTLAFLIGNLFRQKELLTQIAQNEVLVSQARHHPQHVADEVMRVYKTVLEDFKIYDPK